MDSFEQIIGRAERKNVDRDLVFSNKDAQLVYKLIREFFEQYPDCSGEECYQELLSMFYNINMQVMRMPSIKSDLIRFQTANRLLEHDYMRKEAYERVIAREKAGEVLSEGDVIQYNGNRTESEDLLVIQTLIGLRSSQKDNESMRETVKKYAMRTPKERRAITQSFDKQSKEGLAVLVDLFAGDEYEQFTKFLKSYEPIFRKGIRENSIDFAMQAESLLRKFGTMELYEEQQQRLFRQLGLEKVTEIFGEHPLDEKVFSKENLSLLDTHVVITLDAFWINRLTKELENYNTSLFLINSLGLWDKIRNAEEDPKTGEINIEVPEEDLEKLYRKVYFLRGLIDQVYTNGDELPYKYVEDKDEEKKEAAPGIIKKNKKYKSIDIEALDRIISSRYGKKYEDYFGRLMPGESHTLTRDFNDFRIMDNAKKNAYLLKDNMMISLLATLLSGKGCKNWGVVEESAANRFIILAVDTQGLNLPARLHIEKNLVKDFLRVYKGDTKIQIYKGNDDFEIGGRQVSTQFLIPVKKDKAVLLKSAADAQPEGSDRRKLLEHMSYICGLESFPEHLRDNVKKKHKKGLKKRNQTRYIDLVDGKKYIKNSQGVYQEEIQKEGWSMDDE